jgi:DNA-binding transcriptional LysR family regulator
VDLRILRYFLCVAEEKSISAAAKKLHMSQPPLSRQILLLEEEMEVSLFLRRSDGLVLTEAGEVLQRRGIELIRHYEMILSEMRQLAQSKTNNISLGTNNPSIKLTVPIFVEIFKSKYRNTNILIYSGTTNELTSKIIKKEVEIGFIRMPFDSVELFDIVKLHNEGWIALFSKKHPLAKYEKELTISTLLDYKFIMPARESLYLPLVQALTQEGKIPDVSCYYLTFMQGIALVESELGVALMPACVEKAENLEKCVAKGIKDLKLETALVAVKLKGEYSSEIAHNFWNMIQQYENKL